jgi:hypothetical protein
MPLPHFTNIESSHSNFEPVYKNLFEVTIILPPAIQSLHPKSEILLLENATKVAFPTYPAIETTDQRFKFSTRKFLKMPTTTSTEFDIEFNMNQNNEYQVYTFRMMKDWYDLVYNNEDGSVHYKKNIISDIVVHGHDKEGHVIRRVTYRNCQILSFTGWETLDWGSNEIASLTTKFVADYWEDYYY